MTVRGLSRVRRRPGADRPRAAVRPLRLPAGPARLGHLDRRVRRGARCSARSCPGRWPTGSTGPASPGSSPRWSSCWPGRCSARSSPARPAARCARRVTWEPAKMVDSVAGAVVSAIAVLLVAWMVASPLASSPFPHGRRPGPPVRAGAGGRPRRPRRRARGLRHRCATAIDRRGLPDVLDPLTPTQVRDVPAPDQALLASPVVASVQGLGGEDQRDRAVLLPADRRVGLRLRAGAGDDQRPRAGRRHRPGGAGRGRGVRRDPGVRRRGDRHRRPRRPRPAAGAADRSRPTPADTGDDAIIMGYPGGGAFYVGPARVRDRGRDQRAGLPGHRRPSSATSTRCSGPCAPATPAARCSPPTAACWASSSPPRSTTRAPATR